MMKPFGSFVGLDRQLGVFIIYWRLKFARVPLPGGDLKTCDDRSCGVSLNDRNVMSTFPDVDAFLAVGFGALPRLAVWTFWLFC